jgi:hypothetical protein
MRDYCGACTLPMMNVEPRRTPRTHSTEGITEIIIIIGITLKVALIAGIVLMNAMEAQNV